MKKIFLSLFLFVATFAVAQERRAVQLLDEAVAKIEKEAPVQMLFDYTVCDSEGNKQFSDNGSIKLNGGSYALLLTQLKMWCDGVTQWVYMASNDEIYISDASSDESQIYNPVFLMNLHKNGYDASLEREKGNFMVTLLPSAGEQFSIEKVVIGLNGETLRPGSLRVYMGSQGWVDIAVSSYKPRCMFENRVYRCPLEDFPTAEVIDMR